MNDQNDLYKRQHKNALKTYEKLKLIKSEIDFKLKSDPVCSHLHKDLREVNLNIKITLNEIEHIESHLFGCESLNS
jgi:hypothetical protein